MDPQTGGNISQVLIFHFLWNFYDGIVPLELEKEKKIKYLRTGISFEWTTHDFLKFHTSRDDGNNVSLSIPSILT